MSAAVTAASMGLRVLLAEASPCIGGTTAISAGSLWIPASFHDLSGEDSPETALRFLDATVGNHSPADLRKAFLARGPEMVEYLNSVGALDLAAYPHHPDYLADAPGATLKGRALGAKPFDGRKLGRNLRLLRTPLPEFTIFGGMMVDRTDIGHLLNAHRNFTSFRYAAGLLLRHGFDRLTGPRGTRLVMGNALAGRLLWSLLRFGVELRTECKVSELVERDGRIAGAMIDGRFLEARRGVIVSAGGFPHHPRLRQELYPQPVAEHSAVPATNSGGGIDLLLRAGGHLSSGHANPAFWAPSSVRRRKDGTLAVFPHFVLDRAKPGIIAVNREGRRFVNESTSYQLFVDGMYRAKALPCYLVCNGAFIRKNGLGMIRPRTLNLAPHVADGYIAQGKTLEELATRIGVDPRGLADSVARNDRYAREGVDPDFHRGANAYNRNLGDPSHGPNPCLGPIGDGPYYALTIHPADIGTSIGIETDGSARVLNASGQPIPGLYAAGADMSSIMGGIYPAPGITIGPAMAFGYTAARHAATESN